MECLCQTGKWKRYDNNNNNSKKDKWACRCACLKWSVKAVNELRNGERKRVSVSEVHEAPSLTTRKRERETVCPLSPSVQCRRRSQLWNRWPIDNQWRSVLRECHQQQCLSSNQKCRKQIAQKIWDANHTRTYTLSQYHSIACFEARRKVGCQRRVTRKNMWSTSLLALSASKLQKQTHKL